MPYTPNPEDVAAPLITEIAETAAAEFRALKLFIRDELRRITRRTNGWARGHCLAVSTNQTLNTADMAAGYTFSLYNDSANSITVSPGVGVTLRLAGSASTGVRTVAARGLITIWCNSGTEAIVIGAGVT